MANERVQKLALSDAPDADCPVGRASDQAVALIVQSPDSASVSRKGVLYEAVLWIDCQDVSSVCSQSTINS